MRRSSFLPFVAIFGASVAAIAAAVLAGSGSGSAPISLLPAACDTTDSSTVFVPVTGIIIRTDSLISGIGCGPADDEVYKYVAFVSPAKGSEGGSALESATVVDCFADGVLVNLSTATTESFDITILAFNESTWNQLGPQIDPAVLDAGSSALAAMLAMYQPQANWVTTCTATETQQVQAVALCSPLSPNGVMVVDGSADGVAPGDAGPDAEADARADSAVDAPADTGAADAPADVGIDAPPVDAGVDAPGTTDAADDAPDGD